MGGVFRWAVKNNLVKIDPTANVDKPQRKTGAQRRGNRFSIFVLIGGFVWRVSAPPMSPQKPRHWHRAYRFGKQHVQAGEMKTEKTGQIVYPEIGPELAATLAATRDANAGASEATLEARYGWTGGRMASLYTRTANRRKLAKQTHQLEQK